jgi:isochorismate synthase
VAGPVKHLRTDFSFRTTREETELLDALHPTPAVSGLPRALALEIIENIEEHDRSIYTGYIGLLSPKDSKIYVNLRCCQIRPGNMFLYLGGGYTKDSNPELEWEETENKSKTLLDLVQKL